MLVYVGGLAGIAGIKNLNDIMEKLKTCERKNSDMPVMKTTCDLKKKRGKIEKR
jgi:hypothetical protein